MNSKYKLRQMTTEDIFRVAELEREIFSDAWSPASFASSLKNRDQSFFVVTDGDRIVGYIGVLLVLDECQILNVAVDESYRRKGIGGELLDAVMDYALQHGCVLFTLEVRESNKAARALYKKYGFIEVGCRKDYYTDPLEAAILMDCRK